MASFTAGDVTLAYEDVSPAGGAARTIVLLHGYASNRTEGWRRTGFRI
jgi:pimeloyl-ACP methyl ester carboxylesterase